MQRQNKKHQRTIFWIWLSFSGEQISQSQPPFRTTVARFAQHPGLRTGHRYPLSSHADWQVGSGRNCSTNRLKRIRKSWELDWWHSINISFARDEILRSSDEMIYIDGYSTMTRVSYKSTRTLAPIPWWIWENWSALIENAGIRCQAWRTISKMHLSLRPEQMFQRIYKLEECFKIIKLPDRKPEQSEKALIISFQMSGCVPR
jgi:hypothetical protein